MPLRSNQAKQIVALTHEFYPDRGGIATYVREVARATARAGRSIEVWAPRHSRAESPSLPFPVRQLPLKGSQDWTCRVRLALHLWRQRSEWRDVLWFLPEPGPIATWMYLQLLHATPPGQVVIALHGSEINQFTRLFYRRFLFRRLLGRAQRIGVVSNYVKDLLLSKFPELGSKTVLAPGSAPVGTDSTEPRKHDASDSTMTILLTVARIHPRKGQLAVMDALSRLPEHQLSRIEYRLAGPIVRPRYMRKLRRLAHRHGVRFRHLGCLDDEQLGEAYRQADIFVMTSVAHRRGVEGFGLAYLEASAHGLPIIAHRIGGVEDAVKDGESGILVDPNDRDALAQAIIELTEHAELRHTLGEAGRRWAQRFSWDATARSLFGDV